MTTALFMLRCFQVGIKLSDLDFLNYGMVLDILTENSKDYAEATTQDNNSARVATQADYDKF